MGKYKDRSTTLPQPMNEKQKQFINGIQNYLMTIAIGPAGTGKSYISSMFAGHYLKDDKHIDKIVITRPAVPTGNTIGLFPGTLEEKMEPWLKPIMDTVTQLLGRGVVESQLKNGNIEIVPFDTIRGRSFDNAFIILDEAQNCTLSELKAFITRQGKYSKVVITGDETQSDLNGKGSGGLRTLLKLVEGSKGLSKHVCVVEFDSDDIVRSGLCKLWVKAFEGIE